MYLSRLAAMKEFAFMKALKDEGFPVPEPIAQNRHTIVMSFIDSFPLRQISNVPDPALLYSELIDLLLRLAKHGLIHGDYNEFNILIKEEVSVTTEEGDEESIKLIPIVIDFPQMVSMDHENAEMYFDRDVNCIKRFFEKRFKFTPTTPGPFYKDAKKLVGKGGATRIDATLTASGFTKKMAKDLEKAIQEQASSKNDEGEFVGEDDDEEYGSEEDDEEEEESGDEAPDAENASVPTANGDGKEAQTGGRAEDEVDTQKFSKLTVAEEA